VPAAVQSARKIDHKLIIVLYKQRPSLSREQNRRDEKTSTARRVVPAVKGSGTENIVT
jgi:hypothetical protein